MEEYREEEDCRCENCDYEGLRHFEKCPVCDSEAFHITLKPIKTEEESS